MMYFPSVLREYQISCKNVYVGVKYSFTINQGMHDAQYKSQRNARGIRVSGETMPLKVCII